MPAPIFQDPRFDALRNALYHTARGRFLDALNRLFNFLVIVSGAAVVGKFAQFVTFNEIYIELAIVVIATIQLVFDYGGRACTHLFLQKRYYELLAEIETSPDADDENVKRAWSAKLLTIAADEPLPMRALDALAYNTALDALINDQDELKRYRLHVWFWQRWLKHLFAFQGTQFLPRPEGYLTRFWKWASSKIRRGAGGKAQRT